MNKSSLNISLTLFIPPTIITTSIKSLGTDAFSISWYKTVSMILIPELYAILVANFNEKEWVTPIISVDKPPFSDEQIYISSFSKPSIILVHFVYKSS